MGEVVQHPMAEEKHNETTYRFVEGGSVTIRNPEGEVLTVKDAVYMLQDLLFRINCDMYGLVKK